MALELPIPFRLLHNIRHSSMKIILLELLSIFNKPLLRIGRCYIILRMGIANEVISRLQDLQTKRCDLVSVGGGVGVLRGLRGLWRGYRSKGMIFRCPSSDLKRFSIKPPTRLYH
jgi:hypothetical protein